MNSTENGEFWSVRDICAKTGICKMTMSRDLHEGRFPGAFRKANGRWQIPKSIAERFCEAYNKRELEMLRKPLDLSAIEHAIRDVKKRSTLAAEVTAKTGTGRELVRMNEQLARIMKALAAEVSKRTV